MSSNREFKKMLNKMLLYAKGRINNDYCFLISEKNNTNIKSYKGFNVLKFNMIIKDMIYLTEFKKENLYYE